MIVKANNNWAAMTDGAIIKQIGQFIKKSRISKNKTQAQVAEAAGINRWTIGQVENGEPVALTSLIQILRALDLLYVLDGFNIQNQISPLMAVKLQPKERQRASGTPKSTKSKSNW